MAVLRVDRPEIVGCKQENERKKSEGGCKRKSLKKMMGKRV